MPNGKRGSFSRLQSIVHARGARRSLLSFFFDSCDNYHRREESEAHMFLVVKQCSPQGVQAFKKLPRQAGRYPACR